MYANARQWGEFLQKGTKGNEAAEEEYPSFSFVSFCEVNH
jgi:hypothetical protein